MHTIALLLSAFAGSCILLAGATHPKDLFNRAKDYPQRIEKKVPGAPFADSALQRRAAAFLYEATEKYEVNGTTLPLVNFDIGESYAGLMPISNRPDETRELFFWFFPSPNPAAAGEITIWMNGGPGCSSLSGMINGIGPFTWMPGIAEPVINSWSWANLTNVVFVEYPVGVGFSEGQSNVDTEIGVAQQFLGFWRNFATAFCLEYYRIYLAGESYAGYYIPYIADAMIGRADVIYSNLQGIFINSPIFGDQTNHGQTVVAPFVRHWDQILNFNDTFLEAVDAYSKECGYEDYLKDYFRFPAPQLPLPLLPNPYLDNTDFDCDIFDYVIYAALEQNPCFNYYRIIDQCPYAWSPLGPINIIDFEPVGTITYFDLYDVQEAIHAPNKDWNQCIVGAFRDPLTGDPTNDHSPPPANNGVLQRVIDHTRNVLVGTGDLDYLLPTNGTLLAIQNTTFGGRQGLDEYPSKEFYVPYHADLNPGSMAGAGIVGTWTSERGLTYFRLAMSGHQIPQHAPGAAYRAMELMLGRIESLGDTSTFTTLQGDYTGEFTPSSGNGERSV